MISKKVAGIGVVAVLLAGSLGLSYTFMPKLDYLPDGNANFVFGRIIVPPGYSMDETLRIAERMENAAAPLWDKDLRLPDSPRLNGFSLLPLQGAPLQVLRQLSQTE